VSAVLERTTFSTPRALDYFSVVELEQQTGQPRSRAPAVAPPARQHPAAASTTAHAPTTSATQPAPPQTTTTIPPGTPYEIQYPGGGGTATTLPATPGPSATSGTGNLPWVIRAANCVQYGLCGR